MCPVACRARSQQVAFLESKAPLTCGIPRLQGDGERGCDNLHCIGGTPHGTVVQDEDMWSWCKDKIVKNNGFYKPWFPQVRFTAIQSITLPPTHSPVQAASPAVHCVNAMMPHVAWPDIGDSSRSSKTRLCR